MDSQITIGVAVYPLLGVRSPPSRKCWSWTAAAGASRSTGKANTGSTTSAARVSNGGSSTAFYTKPCTASSGNGPVLRTLTLRTPTPKAARQRGSGSPISRQGRDFARWKLRVGSLYRRRRPNSARQKLESVRLVSDLGSRDMMARRTRTSDHPSFPVFVA